MRIILQICIMKDSANIIIIFLLVIFLSVWFSSSPYGPQPHNMYTSNHTPYEGFHQRLIPLEYTLVSDSSKAVDDTYLVRSIQPVNVDCKKVNGFDGMGVFCNPTSAEQKIDIYSDAPGKLDCESVGLYNSKGSLCLDKTMIDQLQTRGGNAKGGFGQYGSSR